MDQTNNTTICWLKITDYMRGWIRSTLGGTQTVKGQPVISVHYLPGASEIMMMPTVDVLPGNGKLGIAISATWRNALDAGIAIDAATIESEYGVTREILRQYMPIACPRRAVSKDGIIRPWTNDTCFGKKQAMELLRLLRDAFWSAVWEFSARYAEERPGEKYAQVEMIEAFCRLSRTDDLYIEAIRREWQRRVKRAKG